MQSTLAQIEMSDLPTITFFDKFLLFLMGGYPNIQAIVATIAFYLAHIVLYVICLARNWKLMIYHPTIVSELALEPHATSIYQMILLVTLISGYCVIRQRYIQVYRLISNNVVNKVAFILGMYSHFHMPLIFIYPVDTWPKVHQVVAFLFFVVMTIYIALNAYLTKIILKRYPTMIKRGGLFIISKAFIVILSVILLAAQIGLILYKQTTNYNNEYKQEKWKWLNVTASVIEWLHIISLILGVLFFAYEMNPKQLYPHKGTISNENI